MCKCDGSGCQKTHGYEYLLPEDLRKALVKACAEDCESSLRVDREFRLDVAESGFTGFAAMGNEALVEAFFDAELSEQHPEVVSMFNANKEVQADDAFEGYDFGDNVEVEDSDHWDTNEPLDYTKIVYVRYAVTDETTSKVSLHVRFYPNGSIQEVYALEMTGGNYIGHSPIPTTRPNK
jgi:hypothetical protein